MSREKGSRNVVYALSQQMGLAREHERQLCIACGQDGVIDPYRTNFTRASSIVKDIGIVIN